MRLLATLLASVIATSAVAGNQGEEWNPPARYDHAYAGHLTVRYLPQKKVITSCAALFKAHGIDAKGRFTQRGCAAITGPTSCVVIVIDQAFGLTKPGAVLRHEVGHCNGWGSDHHD